MQLLALSIILPFSIQLAQAKVYQSLDDLPVANAFDFIIAGGGTAGSVIASRLSEDSKLNVLLIEAGPDNTGVLELIVPGFGSRIDSINGSIYNWNYVTVPQPGCNNRVLAVPRGHVLGGSSSINGMAYTRGSADDYDLWGRVTGDHRRWSWKALFPYIKRHERWLPPAGGRNVTGQYDPKVHGYDGNTLVSLPWSGPTEFDLRSLKNTEVQKEFPFTLDPNAGAPLGVTWMQSTIGNGERSSAAFAYLGPKVRERPNLTILLNTYITRVLPVESSKKLDFRTIEIGPQGGGDTKTITASKEIILTAGVIGSAQILLNSGIGNKTDLEAVGVKVLKNLPDVGQGMTDHVTTNAAWTANVTAVVPVDPAAALAQWQKDRTGPLTELFSHQILWSRIPKNSSIFKQYKDPAAGPTSPHLEMPLSGGGGVIGAIIALLTPHSRGSVKLQSNNPFDRPLIDLGFLTHPFDVLALKEGIRIAKRFYSGAAWEGYITGFLGPDPDTLSDAEFETIIRNGAASFLHPVGTAAMSPKGAKHGVVDPDLRVKGVRGLRVADAAVIPYVPTAHTQAAVYILSEHAVDLIRESW